MRPDDPELARLLDRFIPVRIVNFKGVDMNRFRFDTDLTFAVLMMDADGHTYARFGSQDWRSSSARMSIAGLKNAMRAVLARHGEQRGKPSPPAEKRPRFTLTDIPAFARSEQAKEECYHCHYAGNFRFKQLQAERKFLKEMLFQYPLPENVGLTLDVDRNNVVRAVTPGSPAAKAGLRAGDVLVSAGETPVITAADLQFALDPIPDPGTVTLAFERAGKRQAPVTLPLPRGWRRTDISWRASAGGIPPTVGIWAEPLDEARKKDRGIPADRMALRVSFFFPGAEWAKTRGDLKMNDVIVGINGEALPAMTTRQFHSRFRLNFAVGDTVTLNVLRSGERLAVRVPCLDVEG